MRRLLPPIPLPESPVTTSAPTFIPIVLMCAADAHVWTEWFMKPAWPNTGIAREERRCATCDAFQSRYPKESP